MEPGLCNWSRDFEPVEGWEAEEVTIKYNKRGQVIREGSYRITSCPEFVRDAKDGGMIRLGRAVTI